MDHSPAIGNAPSNHATGQNEALTCRSSPSSGPAPPSLLEKLSDGKTENTTGECGTLHAHVESLLCSLRRHMPLPCVGRTVDILGSASKPIIAEAITTAGASVLTATPALSTPYTMTNKSNPVTVTDGKEVPNASPVIQISDDENDEKRPRNTFASGSKQNINNLQLVPVPSEFDYSPFPRCAVVKDWQPCIQYEKVTLCKMAGSNSYQDTVELEVEAPLLKPLSITSSRHNPRKLGNRPSRGTRAPNTTRKRKLAVASINGIEGPYNLNNGKADRHVLPEFKKLIEKNDPDAIGHPDSKDDLQSQSSRTKNSLHSISEELQTDDLCKELWKEMSMAYVCFPKDTSAVIFAAVKSEEDEKEDCDHSFILKDDVGLVCRVCGKIDRKRDQIIDFQWSKGPKLTQIYSRESRSSPRLDGKPSAFVSKIHEVLIGFDICIHPRHEKALRPHQLEGFRFLVRNLIAEKPGGCILAHAPGSGKTLMIISFIQSFLGKYTSARPLIVLPKGILQTWKTEFQTWQVEEFPVYDFYSVKADSRSQQLGVLRNWEENRSILFLGYKQFSNIICEGSASEASYACKDILLRVPSLLILDEGHIPRNDTTDVLTSLARVETPRKVVLSGTLFQNHVKEVFNILNLVQPKFLQLDSSRMVVQRIMCRVGRRCRYDGNAFFESVEETLRNNSDLKRKVTIIKDLREMTKDVLHYYRGDFLDELPGLIDFTVFLRLTPKQIHIVKQLGELKRFRRYASCSAAYMHPFLSRNSDNVGADKICDLNIDRVNKIIDGLNVEDGVKTAFFLHLLAMSVSAGEKMLVFSQYLLPLKFLERLLSSMKGWCFGKEMFMISGDTSTEQRELSIEQFNNSPDAKILFGSIRACGEGISLTGASRVVILDVHLNPSVSRQAIARAFRPGQTKKVYAYRLIAADSHEEEHQATSFRKELISKMWFDWSEFSDAEDFQLAKIDIKDSGDMFFENPSLAKYVEALYRR